MRKILLTGASGFVGTQILNFLAKEDVLVIPVVRNGNESRFENYSNILNVISSADIFNESSNWWAKQCLDVDTVIHCAWYAEPEKYLHSSQNINCLIGSLNLAKGLIKAGVRKFIGLGTCFEYDLSCKVLSIDTPLKPTSPYAGAKSALYETLSNWLPGQSVEFAWCRLFYLFGEGDDERRLVPYLHKQFSSARPAELKNANLIRDYLEVSKAGELITKVAMGNQSGPINICSGVPVTIRQLAEKIALEYGRIDLIKFGKDQRSISEPECVLGIPNYDLIYEEK